MFRKSINSNIILCKQATAKGKEQHYRLGGHLMIRCRYRLIFCSLQQWMPAGRCLSFFRLLEHFEKQIAHSGYATPQRSSIGSFLYVPGTKMHSCQSELNLKVHSKEFYHESSFCYFEQFMEGNSWQGVGKAFIRSKEFDKSYL